MESYVFKRRAGKMNLDVLDKIYVFQFIHVAFGISTITLIKIKILLDLRGEKFAKCRI